MSTRAEILQCGYLDDLLARVSRRFARPEPRQRLRAVVLGLLADLPRKNAWTLAEHAGDCSPHGVQHLLARAVWDTDGIAADLRSFVVDHLGDPDGVLVVDETGHLKKGTHTVGVQRQYTGTAGRIENAQVGVYRGYATAHGHAVIDRELYLSRSWTQDGARCAAAGVPAGVAFATKPALATAMIARALDAGVPARWVAGDEVYGADPKLTATLQARGIGYVLAVAGNRRIRIGITHRTVKQVATALPGRSWQTRSAGDGAHGPRLYEWAWVHHDPPTRTDQRSDQHADQPAGVHSVLIRRHRRTKVLAYYRCWSPSPVPLGELVTVAGRRWTIEESFQAAKGLAGLDEHQVRTWTSWRRWTLLAMLAHALLAVATAHARRAQPTPDGLIALTCNEIRRLITAALAVLTNPDRVLAWSRWRRAHQHRARTSHYARREHATS